MAMTDWSRPLLVSYRMAALSPDPSTQNGALVCDSDGLIIPVSVEANRFPDRVKPRLERPEKYDFIEHAERSAIYECARFGVPTFGMTLVACWASCAACARAVVRSGISRLVRHAPPDDGSTARWRDSVSVGDTIMQEAGVEIVEVCGPIPGAPAILRDGRLWQP